MYEFKIGTIFLIALLIIILAIIRRQVTRGNERIQLDIWLVGAIFFRLAWMLVVIMLENKMTFFVWDDESYYKTAMGLSSIPDDANGYYYLLSWIYNVFGKSSLNGRLFNMFVSVMTIYPLASLEYSMNEETSFRATKFYALSPFQIFISFFEIKDIVLMFTFISSYAVIKKMKDNMNFWMIVQLILLCVISEQFRSGAGVIPIAILIIAKVSKGIGSSRGQRILSATFCVALVLIFGYIFMQDYLGEGAERIEKYQNWIFTQFSSSSIYNYFVITRIQDIWKLPFCYILYAIQPLNALDGSGRFFGEFGMIAKMIDVPILLMGLRWIFTYIKREGIYSLMFLLPYSFVSGINLTNARQGFFLYPILYLMCFYGYEQTDPYGGTFWKSRRSAQITFGILYFVWTCLVISRIF